jgi:hypothetical protein
MKACSSCGCHHRESETTCPHCGTRVVLGRPTAAALLLGLALVAPGCGVGNKDVQALYGAPCTDSCAAGIDNDGDGYSVAVGDCDDDDPDINPGATETAGDDVDSNCDGDNDT